jgi:hypothetical protein
MKKNIYIYISIVLYLYIMSGTSYSCDLDPDPNAVIYTFNDEYIPSGGYQEFNGSASQGGFGSSIIYYKWWQWNGSSWNVVDEGYNKPSVWVQFPSVGYYQMCLEVEDEYENWDYTYTCEYYYQEYYPQNYYYDFLTMQAFGIYDAWANKTEVALDESVTFYATSITPSGMEYWTVWRENGNNLGEHSPFQTSFASAGTHNISAAIGNTTKSVSIPVVVVSSVSKDKAIAGVSEDITFTANSNPSAKPFSSIEWQKRYRLNSSSSWEDWGSANGGDNTAVLNTTTAGLYQYRARNGSSDAWKESSEVAIVKVENLRFEKNSNLKNWITPCTLAGAYSNAIADITPSNLSITYEIVGTAHGASINSSSGKITHNGSNDGGIIQIKAYATAYPSALAGPENFTIKAKPVAITATTPQNPYTYFSAFNIYGFNKKHTFSSSTGNVAELDGMEITEYVHYTQNSFESIPPDLEPKDNAKNGNTWTLDATGKMTEWDTHAVSTSIVSINDFWPNSFPAAIVGTQKWYWFSVDGDDWVYISDEPVITFNGSLNKLPQAGGVTAFKFTYVNNSTNPQAQLSSDNINYIKSGTPKAPPQYYVGPTLSWSNVQSTDLTVTPSAATITPGSQLSVTMAGIAGVTEAEVAAASKPLTFLLTDEEPVFDDVLWTISNENIFSATNGGVPAGATDGNGNIKGNIVVSFSVTKTNALNQRKGGTIIGPDEESGELEAEISFEIDVPGDNPEPAYSIVNASAYNPPAPTVSPNPIPLSGNATVTMSGCTEATVTSGTMNMTFLVIDDDDFYGDDTLVSNISHSFTVPNGQILHGLVNFGNKTATITNDNGIIKGANGSSGEGTSSDPAEIAFEIDIGGSNPQSSNTSVTGVQP